MDHLWMRCPISLPCITVAMLALTGTDVNSVPLGCESWLNLTPGQVTTWTCLCPFNGCLGCLALLCQPTGTCFGQFKVYPKHCYHVLPIWAVSISKLFHVNHLFKLKQVVCVCLCVCVCVCVYVCVCVCVCVCVSGFYITILVSKRFRSYIPVQGFNWWMI